MGGLASLYFTFMFKSNLLKLRSQSGLSQAKVAAALEVELKRYQAWEEGRATPGIDIVGRIAGFYSITIDELVQGDEPRLRDSFFVRYMASGSNVRKAIDILLSAK